MTTTTTPAIYRGSFPAFHGPVEVTLDPVGTKVHGEVRFIATTPDGERLTQVRLASLDFSDHSKMATTESVYCRAHDFYDCPFETANWQFVPANA